ncbi:MAG: FIST C-terminal domain-containing protein [Eubacterium sp.]|nr:FIST C-terminal domain-containing protein [Eubacterium sp.]
MDSVVLYTEEIDELDEAAEELFGQAESFSLKKNTLAILFTVDDTDYHELYEQLHKKWDFPIIGATAMTMLLDEQGSRNDGISVLLLTADDCEFSVGMTGELNTENYREEIGKKYDELKKSHSSDIKLIISYGGMVTKEGNVAGDDLVYALTDASGGVPVYGGTASDSFTFEGFKLFCNDQVTTNGQTIALISGNIDPQFVVINSVDNRASFEYEVTESNSNVVSRLGDETFVGALRKEQMETQKTDVLADYILSPFVLEIKKDDGDSVEVARNLSLLNPEKGTGAFLGAIPEGSILNIGIINQSDVKESIEKAFDTIFKSMNSDGRERHTLLCNSCCARFLALGSDITAEIETFRGRIPDGVAMLGIYAYGEYCPVKGNKSGREYNMFHNFTFTILAI